MPLDPVKIDVRDDRRIGIESEFRDKENIKDNIPGAKWDKEAREWHVPLSWAALKQLRGVFGDRLEVSDRLNELAWQVYNDRILPCLELRDAADADIGDAAFSKNGFELTPLQRAASKFMAVAWNAFELDPMGSGKTPISIAALKLLGPERLPVLVVCGAPAKPHWRDEFAEWFPQLRVVVIDGSMKKRREQFETEADVYVINWELLAKHSRLSGYGNIALSDSEKEDKELQRLPIGTLIVDEVHRAKDPKAKQTRALYKVADRVFEQGSPIWALTGSLIANTPEDLWSPGRIINKDEYPSKPAFVDRYGLLSWSDYGSLKVVGLKGETRDELYSFLDPRMIRRPKEVILPELRGKLPPMTRVVELPRGQRKAYDKLREQMLVELDNGVLVATNPMAKMQRLRQLAGATGDIDDENNVILKMPSAKVTAVLEDLEEMRDESVAIYAESRLLIELLHVELQKAGYDSEMFTGATKATREESRKKFQAGDLQILLLTYGAGAESINLSRAAVLGRLELSWSSVKNNQALERADRKGPTGESEGPVRIIDWVAHDTVDEYVQQAYSDKLEMIEQVMRDEETLRRWLSK